MNIRIYIYVKNLAEKDQRIIIFSSGVNIKEMLKKEGYPFKSKEYSQKVLEFRNGSRSDYLLKYFRMKEGGFNPCPKKLLCQIQDSKLKISHKCCYKLKKEPIKKWMLENNKSITITGMRKEEGGQRSNINCIVLEKNELKKFHPLSVVNEDFENWYILRNNIILCKLYYPPFNFKRTGCKGCPFNVDLEKDLFIMGLLLPGERKQCEEIWKPVYDEYRKLGYRLKHEFLLFDL